MGEEAFADHAAARRPPLHTFDRPQANRTGMRPDDVPAIARWIESLPKPVGIIADCDGLSADEVANATDLSRRSLDRQFAKLLGRSIHDEIVKTKLIAARRLLAETDLKLAAIAARCDFSHAAQFCNVFKKTFGITPTEHRRQCRPWA